MQHLTVEVCVESPESARLADEAGCHRLELCSQLAIGGLTPQIDFVDHVLKQVQCPVVVLIRPRDGDFHYDKSEQETMLRSARQFLEMGVAGIAVGAVNGGHWNLHFMEQIAAVTENSELVAHRAIDRLLGPQPASYEHLIEVVQPLIDFGFHRILTSGGYPIAVQGLSNIRMMIERFTEQIQILPGGGITPENAKFIIDATGARQLHGSFRRLDGEKQIDVDVQRLKKVLSICSDSE